MMMKKKKEQKFFDLSKEKQVEWLIDLIRKRPGITLGAITTVIDSPYEDFDESQSVYAKRRQHHYGRLNTIIRRLIKQRKIKKGLEKYGNRQLLYVIEK